MCNSQNCQSSVVKVEIVINFKGDNSFYMGIAKFEKWVLSMAKEGRKFSFLLDEKDEDSYVVGQITIICLNDKSFSHGLSIYVAVDGFSQSHIMPSYSDRWVKIPSVKMD